jgi:hypothetical protein
VSDPGAHASRILISHFLHILWATDLAKVGDQPGHFRIAQSEGWHIGASVGDDLLQGAVTQVLYFPFMQIGDSQGLAERRVSGRIGAVAVGAIRLKYCRPAGRLRDCPSYEGSGGRQHERQQSNLKFSASAFPSFQGTPPDIFIS